ncbi:MAG: HupE/UreJ family protein, partial [Betaproteobacteria bacterium]
RVFGRYLLEGIWHIWNGIDHICFLLSLLLLAPLLAARQPVHRWRGAATAKPVVMDVLAVVTAFTVAHSITLGLSVMKWLEPSPDVIEPAIALSVVVAALNNLVGWSALRRWRLAFVFGLVHGFGFANVLLDLGLPASALAAALGGFNVGVEIGQLAIVLVFLPLAWLMRGTAFYRWVIVTGGSLGIAVAGLVWTLERIGLLSL